MISHLLSKLPAPRPADWGIGMSVCVAVMCNQKKSIVAVSDQKATFSDFSADYAAIKGRRIYRNWWVMYAGNDVEIAPQIISEATRTLGDDNVEPFKLWDAVVDAVDDAYWTALQRRIESRVLKKHKFSGDMFRDVGKQKCTATVYNNLCAKIEKVDLSLQFLIFGFDDIEHKAHIYVVGGGEEPRCYDSVGVWAIGSGSHAAISSLAFHIDNKHLAVYAITEEEALYFACGAKFMAESSGYVGREGSVVTIHYSEPLPENNPDGKNPKFVLHDNVQKIKELWRAEGAPRVPTKVQERIADLLVDEPMLLGSGMSEPER